MERRRKTPNISRESPDQDLNTLKQWHTNKMITSCILHDIIIVPHHKLNYEQLQMYKPKHFSQTKKH